MPELDDVRILYIPQIPMKAFTRPADDLAAAVKMLDLICEFSQFEFRNHVKPDYSDYATVQRYEEDGEGGRDWFDIDDFELRDMGIIE